MDDSYDITPEGLSPIQLTFLHQVREQGMETKVALLQHHAHLAKLLAHEIMTDEVTALAGEPYKHQPERRFRRSEYNPGIIQAAAARGASDNRRAV